MSSLRTVARVLLAVSVFAALPVAAAPGATAPPVVFEQQAAQQACADQTQPPCHVVSRPVVKSDNVWPTVLLVGAVLFVIALAVGAAGISRRRDIRREHERATGVWPPPPPGDFSDED